MTVRTSVLHDQRARRFAWVAVAVAAAVVAGALLISWRVTYDPWPPAGVSEGVNP